MGQRGPLPKPTATRAREGNPRRRPLPKDEPQPPKLAALPKPPDHLSKEAKAVFTTLCKVLSDADLLTVADVMPVEMLADSYTQWVKTLKLRAEAGVITEVSSVDNEGNAHVVNKYESPESKLCRSLGADCNRWFKVLGLGPAYRVGLRMNAHGGDEIEDPLAASIANG
jgi:P27 family predicted phage terminase small subunit